MRHFSYLAGAIVVFVYCTSLKAQDTVPEGKALNIPFRKYGLSIGNSHEFTGIRINFSDRDVRRINGINITLWPDRSQSFKQWYTGEVEYSSRINGISIGVLPLAGNMNFINAGLIGLAASPGELNGISFGGIFTAAVKINGISVTGLVAQANTVSGVAVSGLALGGPQGINGLAVGGLAVSSDDSDIKGVAISPGIVFCEGNLKGIGIAGIILKGSDVSGLTLAGFSKSDNMNGLSVALINRTKNLHGIQIGLLNFAGNNRKGLKTLPLINLHFKKKSDQGEVLTE